MPCPVPDRVNDQVFNMERVTFNSAFNADTNSNIYKIVKAYEDINYFLS